MWKKKINFQNVPPGNHRANTAERAIQTFKNHFISGLVGVDPKFPLVQWDRLLEQATITLNLLRSARLNPRLSAYNFLFGIFDFNKTPLAPPGTKVLAHVKTDKRKSWSQQGDEGWYIGPSMKHYRCIKVYFPKTRAVRDIDTATFCLRTTPFPSVKLIDYLQESTTDLVTLLKKTPSTICPSLEAGDESYNALIKIAKLLNRADN